MIPRANNAFFHKNAGSNDLEYITTDRDRNRPRNEHGHVSTGPGDSGGPLWKTNPNGIPVLVAIQHGGVQASTEPMGYYANDYEDRTNYGFHYQCSMVVTKITPEILEWVNNKDEEHSILGILPNY